ncbi:MAG: DNRLRE domain-containing protein [Planctomycetaceae bacterium]
MSAGGVSYVNSFTSPVSPPVSYAFAKDLYNNAKYIADAVSHEAGHGFGLLHQSSFDANGNMTAEYSSGSGNWAPIMGYAYTTTINTWHNGATGSATNYQDDMAILAGGINGFGYRPDDYGNTIATATTLAVTSGAITASGIVAQNSDIDAFRFAAGSGTATFQVNTASLGANLDAVLEIYNSSGALVASANPSTTQSASISTTLSAGTYYALVKSNGMYGRVGQYTFTGQVVQPTSGNQSPSVNAGADQTITYGVSANLNATVSDDGLPSPGSVATTWTKVSGTGTVTFGNASAVDTTASFSAAGTYVLRLSANDGQLSSSDDVTIVVNSAPVNQAPTVNAGNDLSITLGNTANLNATVSDDGLPSNSVTTTWTKVSGSGTVTFGNASAVDTTASFSAAGTYVLRLSANDSQLSASDDVTIIVGEPAQTPTTTSFQNGLNGYAGMTDAMIYNKSANKNFGSTTTLDVDGDPDRSALLKWNLSGVSTSTQIESASITLRVTGPTAQTFEIYQLLKSWNESQVTWGRAASGSSWGMAGAQQVNVDRGSTVLGTVTSAASGFVTINLNAAGIAVVQSWISNPASNNGFIIQDYSNTTSDELSFASSEYATVSYRPTLTIKYSSTQQSPKLASIHGRSGNTSDDFGHLRFTEVRLESNSSEDLTRQDGDHSDSVEDFILSILDRRVNQSAKSHSATASHAFVPAVGVEPNDEISATERSANYRDEPGILDAVFSDTLLGNSLFGINASV